jgi:hypothetical protein
MKTLAGEEELPSARWTVATPLSIFGMAWLCKWWAETDARRRCLPFWYCPEGARNWGKELRLGVQQAVYGDSVVPQPNPAPPNALTASWRLEMGLPQGPARAVTEPQGDVDGWIRCGLDAEGGPSHRSSRDVELNFGSWPWTGSTPFLWTIGAAVPFTRQCGFDLHHAFGIRASTTLV